MPQVNPQFGEMDRSEKRPGVIAGYAQQDAEECYSAIINTLRNVPGLDAERKSVSQSAQANVGAKRFVEQYLMGTMERVLSCDEAPEEPPTTAHEAVLKVECNINASTNFMAQGILSVSFIAVVQFESLKLDFDSPWTKRSKRTRPRLVALRSIAKSRVFPGFPLISAYIWCALPGEQTLGRRPKSWCVCMYLWTRCTLTVSQRRVKFPLELDALDFATDDLKQKLLPASRKLKEFERERAERRKVRAKTKVVAPSAPVPSAVGSSSSGEPAATEAGDVEMADADASKGGELQDEEVYREKEAQELDALVDPSVKEDIGTSATGLYELVGGCHFWPQTTLPDTSPQLSLLTRAQQPTPATTLALSKRASSTPSRALLLPRPKPRRQRLPLMLPPLQALPRAQAELGSCLLPRSRRAMRTGTSLMMIRFRCSQLRRSRRWREVEKTRVHTCFCIGAKVFVKIGRGCSLGVGCCQLKSVNLCLRPHLTVGSMAYLR